MLYAVFYFGMRSNMSGTLQVRKEELVKSLGVFFGNKQLFG